jgi:hypothetical protein
MVEEGPISFTTAKERLSVIGVPKEVIKSSRRIITQGLGLVRFGSLIEQVPLRQSIIVEDPETKQAYLICDMEVKRTQYGGITSNGDLRCGLIVAPVLTDDEGRYHCSDRPSYGFIEFPRDLKYTSNPENMTYALSVSSQSLATIVEHLLRAKPKIGAKLAV